MKSNGTGKSEPTKDYSEHGEHEFEPTLCNQCKAIEDVSEPVDNSKEQFAEATPDLPMNIKEICDCKSCRTHRKAVIDHETWLKSNDAKPNQSDLPLDRLFDQAGLYDEQSSVPVLKSRILALIEREFQRGYEAGKNENL
jgi:hypothetical protein